MKKYLFVAVLFILVCYRYTEATTRIIHVQSLSFNPSATDATVGDTIKWVWDIGTHTTTSTSIPGGAAVWDAPIDNVNTSFSYIVTVAGLYNYKCSFHQVNGMIGSVNVSPIGIQPVSGSVPEIFSLSQNYPNPFNPVTIFSFGIPKRTLVKLKVYDISGRDVALLVNEVLEAGTYSVDWDASQYASGTYFYQFVSDGFTQTKKLILLK